MTPDTVAAAVLLVACVAGFVATVWPQAPTAETTALADFDTAAEQACSLTVDYPTAPIPTLDEIAMRRDRRDSRHV